MSVPPLPPAQPNPPPQAYNGAAWAQQLAQSSRPPSQQSFTPNAAQSPLPPPPQSSTPNPGQHNSNGAPMTAQQMQLAQQRQTQQMLLKGAISYTQMAVQVMSSLRTPLPTWFTTQQLPDGSVNPLYLTVGIGEGVAEDGGGGGKRIEAWKLWLPVLQHGTAERAFANPVNFSRFLAMIGLPFPNLPAPTPLPKLASSSAAHRAKPPTSDTLEWFRESFYELFGPTERHRIAGQKRPPGQQPQPGPGTPATNSIPPALLASQPQSTTPSGPPPPSLLSGGVHPTPPAPAQAPALPPVPSPTPPQPQQQLPISHPVPPHKRQQSTTPRPTSSASSSGPALINSHFPQVVAPLPPTSTPTPPVAHRLPQVVPPQAGPSSMGTPTSGPSKVNHNHPPPQQPHPHRAATSFGGWEVEKLLHEQNAIGNSRSPAPVGRFGTLDLDSLTMSLKSRLQAEVGYALQVLEMLANEQNANQSRQDLDGILPLEHCMDLWEELGVLLEETAFGEDGLDGIRERDEFQGASKGKQKRIVQSDLVSRAGDELASSSVARSLGDTTLPRGRPARTTRRTALVLKTVTVIRDLALQRENHAVVARDYALFETLLQLCQPSMAGISVNDETGQLEQDDQPESERLLSLFELLSVRQDTLHILSALALEINLAASTCPPTLLPALIDFLGSYLTDPTVDLYPQGAGNENNALEKVKLFATVADMAIDAFAQLTVRDSNRALLPTLVGEDDLFELYETLARLLPVTEADMRWIQLQRWQSLVEHVALSLYSLAFAAPPALKARLRASRSSQQVLPHVFRGIVRAGSTPMSRSIAQNPYGVLPRRLAEILSQLDDRDDDDAVGLTFGSGFGESKSTGKRKRKVVRGGSWLAGEDRLWAVLAAVAECDEVTWEELEQLYFCT